jgi:DNA-binding response OmpR family regulator
MAKKVLIAEDEPALLSALSAKIGRLGYITIKASDGQIALDKFKEETPDLILLDIMMPEKNGFEVLEELRNNLKSDVPVIILSNLDQTDDIEQGKKFGIIDYIIKSNISLRGIAFKIASVIGEEQW